MADKISPPFSGAGDLFTFPVDADNIQILHTPADFYTSLVKCLQGPSCPDVIPTNYRFLKSHKKTVFMIQLFRKEKSKHLIGLIGPRISADFIFELGVRGFEYRALLKKNFCKVRGDQRVPSLLDWHCATFKE